MNVIDPVVSRFVVGDETSVQFGAPLEVGDCGVNHDVTIIGYAPARPGGVPTYLVQSKSYPKLVGRAFDAFGTELEHRITAQMYCTWAVVLGRPMTCCDKVWTLDEAKLAFGF